MRCAGNSSSGEGWKAFPKASKKPLEQALVEQ